MDRATALLIPSPWSGDENDRPGTAYALWFRLYRTTRVLRHRLGMHDWRTAYPEGDIHTRCSWCGTRRAV